MAKTLEPIGREDYIQAIITGFRPVQRTSTSYEGEKLARRREAAAARGNGATSFLSGSSPAPTPATGRSISSSPSPACDISTGATHRRSSSSASRRRHHPPPSPHCDGMAGHAVAGGKAGCGSPTTALLLLTSSCGRHSLCSPRDVTVGAASVRRSRRRPPLSLLSLFSSPYHAPTSSAGQHLTQQPPTLPITAVAPGSCHRRHCLRRSAPLPSVSSFATSGVYRRHGFQRQQMSLPTSPAAAITAPSWRRPPATTIVILRRSLQSTATAAALSRSHSHCCRRRALDVAYLVADSSISAATPPRSATAHLAARVCGSQRLRRLAPSPPTAPAAATDTSGQPSSPYK
ncbi:mucin-1-like [Zingiber officinale]|uniref:mucin-1-like n=1 Tax=Zingiber officinale TaxID=94328 RepID=UPI001C4D8C76|nr:mucin-1-like [Zingiber officinale]